MGKKCVTKNFESLLWVYVLVEAIVSVPFLLFGIAFPVKLFSLPKCFSSFSMFCLQIYVSQKNDFQTVIILVLVIAFLHLFVKILFSLMMRKKKKQGFIGCFFVYALDLLAFVCNSFLLKPEKFSLIVVHFFGIMFIIVPTLFAIAYLKGENNFTKIEQITPKSYKKDLIKSLPFIMLMEYISAIFVFIDVVSTSPASSSFVDLKTQPIVHLLLNNWMTNENIVFLFMAIIISVINFVLVIAFIKNNLFAGKILVGFYLVNIIVTLTVRLNMILLGLLVDWNLFLLVLSIIIYAFLIFLCVLKIRQSVKNNQVTSMIEPEKP